MSDDEREPIEPDEPIEPTREQVIEAIASSGPRIEDIPQDVIDRIRRAWNAPE